MLNLSRSKNKGFTLIELLVVISIISLLSAIVLTSLNSARARARDTKRITDLKQFQLAMLLLYEDRLEQNSNFLVPAPTSYSYWQNSRNTQSTDASVTCTGSGTAIQQTNWTSTSELNTLLAGSGKAFGALPVDPINDSNHCYIYMPNGVGATEGKSACVWTTLESGRRVGVVIGEPDVNVYSTGFPRGYKCGGISNGVEVGLDEVLGLGTPTSS
jgi:prepilin-type N-terminal cleavage/methylation domain-containing protein